MRLFASLALPQTPADHLEMALRAVDAATPDPTVGRGRPALRWVPPEQRHITLAFYGEVAPGAVDELIADLQTALAEVGQMLVRLRGAGVFTGRTLWAGVQQVAATDLGSPAPSGTTLIELMRVAESIGASYARHPDLVSARDRRRAHVTLARSRDRQKGEHQLRTRAEALAVYEGPSWRVTNAHLMLSELGEGRGGAPLYTALADLQLAG